jgi:predicted deacylase
MRDQDGLPIEAPMVIVRGSASGPLLFTVAGVHGNEYEGMEAVRQVVGDLEPAEMQGDFAAVLTANPFAYAARTRESPPTADGLNLARVFPGDPSGSSTERLAAALLELIERQVGPDDLLLDLHSGTAEVAFATMVGYRAGRGPTRERSEEAARHMGLPLLWEIPDSPGPLNAETARRGIPTIGTETTGRAGCRGDDVAAYRQGLRNLLSYLGICPRWEMPVRDERPARRTLDVHAPASGFLRVETTLLAEVQAGRRLGVVIDPFGAPLAEVVSPISGSVWAARETPHVDAGDLIFMLAERS